jgi:hypothetical protein
MLAVEFNGDDVTLEVYYFIFLVFLGAIFCFVNVNERVYNVISISVFVGWSFVVRYSGFDIDMETYADALTSTSLSLYYLKEPVYWISSRYVFELLGSKEGVFVFFDSVTFLMLLYVRRQWGLPKYFPYLWLCFFPSVMGMQNVYRQYISYHFLLLLVYYCAFSKGVFLRSFVGLLAGFTHNVAFLFAPLLFYFNLKSRVSMRFVSLSLLVLLALPLALSFKSSSSTGVLGAEFYLFVMFFLMMFYLFLNSYVLNGEFAKYFYMQVYFFILTSSSIILMGSAQSKRVGMFCLLISLVPMVVAIDAKCKNKRLMRMVFLLVAVSPTFLFYSSFSLLLS